jgi:exopolysaccharide biosynthesis polyprenyl glycosylphosphotransferase
VSNVLQLYGPKHFRPNPDDRQRGPLRPATLISARRRVNGKAASFAFRLVDTGAMFAWVMVAGFSAALHSGEGLLLLQPLLILGGLGVADVYFFPKGERLRAHLSLLVMVLAITCGITALVAAHSIPALAIMSWELTWALPAAIGLLVMHSGWWCLFRRWRKLELLTPNIVVIGATPQTQRLISGLLASREANVIGIFDDRAERSPTHVMGVPVLGKVDDLITHRLIPYIDSIVIGVGPEARTRVTQMAEQLSVLPNDIYVIDEGAHNAVSAIGGQALSHLAGRPFNPIGAGIKRASDLVLAAMALIILAPILAAVAVAIVLDSKGSVFFRQRRHGFNNEEILVWKFRSMRMECSDATASRQVTANDERVTRVGRFIRRTSLDELPQLINIIRGEMSIVGPRPHAVGMKTTDSDAAALLSNYAQRHRLKPGLTGWAAVNGSRGPVDDIVLLQDRIALDLEYVDRQSFWLDLWIMLRTLPCLLGDKATVR